MDSMRRVLGMRLFAAIVALGCAGAGHAQGAPADAQVTRAVGTIKSTAAGSLLLTTDAGGEVTATLSASTKILRVPPGEKDLKNATPLQSQELQPGDRVLVRGQGAADGKEIAALAVVVMKQADVSARQEHDREDWQKRGVGGLVTAVDPASGAITISAASMAGNRNIVVLTSKSTTARRYAPDSVKFDDAKPAQLGDVRVGDQMRARGTRNADGSELAAEDIVFGSFRNIAGTVTSIDAAANSVTVHDVIAKAPVTVKLTKDSQIKKLPAEMAQRIAMRLKGGAGEGSGQSAPGQAPTNPGSASPSGGQNWGGQGGGQWQRGGSGQSGGPPDLQRFLGRLPAIALSDLQKGDAVMIVAAQGSDAAAVTAITVLGGVEPILTAAPARGGLMLSPWSLGGGEGESGAQ